MIDQDKPKVAIVQPSVQPSAAELEERTIEGMRIVRQGPGFYFCYSSSIPGVSYAVDVTSYNGLGSCTCHNFTCTRLPKWRTSGKKNLNAWRCKHLTRVRNYVLDQLIAHFSQRR